MRSPDRHSVEAQNGAFSGPDTRILDGQNGAARNINRNGTDSQNGTTRGADRLMVVDTQNGATKSSSQHSSGHKSRTKFLRGLFKRRRSSTTREKDSGRTHSPRAAHSQPDVRMCSPAYTPQCSPSYSPHGAVSYSPQCTGTPSYSPQCTPVQTPLQDTDSGSVCMDPQRIVYLQESPPGRTFCGMTTCGGSVQSLDAIVDYSSGVMAIRASVSINLLLMLIISSYISG